MIYDRSGRRKYLTINERDAFISASAHLPPREQTFCLTLVYTGARISEILALTPGNFDQGGGFVIIESLKKRRRGVFRAVPLPSDLFENIERAHNLALSDINTLAATRLWPWSRTRAWNLVKTLMLEVGIAPDRAMPKSLRHAFGVTATQKNIPLNTIQKWMGHARITTTAIYADAVGEEERSLASRLWP